MKIFLDTADIKLISPAYDTGLIDGVTTNPTLILKSGRTLQDVAHELSGLLNLESICFNSLSKFQPSTFSIFMEAFSNLSALISL